MNPILSLIQTLTYRGLEHFGRYYSLYRAFVADVEDPDNLNRLKLIIPQISGNQAYNYWAYPRNVFSGDGYGTQCLPKKGDVVWVEFEGGHPEIPVWSHGYRAKNELPKSDPDLKDVNCYWFMSPKGQVVKVYDTKNLIHIENNTTNFLELNEKGSSVVSKKSISLGKLNKSDYKAVLGEPTEEVLNKIQDFLEEFSAALNKDLIASASSPYLKKENLSSKGFKLYTTAIQIKALIKKILSNKVTLD